MPIDGVLWVRRMWSSCCRADVEKSVIGDYVVVIHCHHFKLSKRILSLTTKTVSLSEDSLMAREVIDYVRKQFAGGFRFKREKTTKDRSKTNERERRRRKIQVDRR